MPVHRISLGSAQLWTMYVNMTDNQYFSTYTVYSLPFMTSLPTEEELEEAVFCADRVSIGLLQEHR